MKTNDIKKGMEVRLTNGWKAICADNMKGISRMFKVEGFYAETGSIYVWDIDAVKVGDTDQSWERIELTPQQLKQRSVVEAFQKYWA